MRDPYFHVLVRVNAPPEEGETFGPLIDSYHVETPLSEAQDAIDAAAEWAAKRPEGTGVMSKVFIERGPDDDPDQWKAEEEKLRQRWMGAHT